MGKAVGKIASKYARALLASVERELGFGTDGADKTPAQDLAVKLSDFSDAFTKDKDLHNALLSPMFPEAQRASALNSLCALFELPKSSTNFIKLMFERGRLPLLSEVSQAFSELADRAANVVAVEVITAHEVTTDEQSKIAESLKKTIPGKLQFQWTIDSEILGGMLVRYAGFILDGTVRSSLNRVGQSLLQ